eukprot:gene25450-biopygen1449
MPAPRPRHCPVPPGAAAGAAAALRAGRNAAAAAPPPPPPPCRENNGTVGNAAENAVQTSVLRFNDNGYSQRHWLNKWPAPDSSLLMHLPPPTRRLLGRAHCVPPARICLKGEKNGEPCSWVWNLRAELAHERCAPRAPKRHCPRPVRARSFESYRAARFRPASAFVPPSALRAAVLRGLHRGSE